MDETIQLRVLLLWLAWDLGEELTEQIGRIWDAKELQAMLRANAMFLKLIPPIAADDSARADLEQSISRTVRPTPEAAQRAQKWLEHHWNFGLGWSKGFDTSNDIRLGGFCCVPGKVDEPHVVLELSDSIVGFWNFDGIRKFEKSRVLGVCAKSA